MKNEIKIVPTTIDHVRMLASSMRDEDRREVERLGTTPFKGLWRSYRNSRLCQSGFIGDDIVAIWGLNGAILGSTGNPWVMTSTLVDKFPFVFAMIYRRELKKMLERHDTLESFVDAEYAKSLRMMEVCGFKRREVVPMGKNGELFVRLEMAAGV